MTVWDCLRNSRVMAFRYGSIPMNFYTLRCYITVEHFIFSGLSLTRLFIHIKHLIFIGCALLTCSEMYGPSSGSVAIDHLSNTIESINMFPMALGPWPIVAIAIC